MPDGPEAAAQEEPRHSRSEQDPQARLELTETGRRWLAIVGEAEESDEEA
jgi:hypothetical protein